MNRTFDFLKTMGGGGLVPVPFKFAVDADGQVTSQYPSTAFLHVEAVDPTANTSWYVTTDTVVDVIAVVAGAVVDADTLDAKVEARVFAASQGGAQLQARQSSDGTAVVLPDGAIVSGVIWLRNSTVAV
jgi:hypothetical protein